MNHRSHNRAPFFFVLFTAFVDFVLAAIVHDIEQGPERILLTTCILGLSLAQMALCLILMMRHVAAWKIPLGGGLVSLAFGLTVTIGPWAAPFDRIAVVLLATLLFGIAPLAIYRIVFFGLQVQFSLSLLFGLMTLVTIACALVVQINPDWQWFITYLFFFIGSAIPIPLAGSMLVGPRTASTPRYVMWMSLSLVISMIIAVTSEQSVSSVSLVGQIGGYMSLYLLIGGVILLHDAKVRIQTLPTKPAPEEEDPFAAD
ncbi:MULTISPECIES: hypothetical protein [Pirellulaceae]|nr:MULTISPECIES: hypothetical protein [Pirellulaceae]